MDDRDRPEGAPPELVRAVDDLFRRVELKRERRSEPEPEIEVPPHPPPSSAGPPTGVSTEDLRRALAGFLAASAADRTTAAVRVRLQAEVLETAGEYEGIATAVERMLLARADDDGARDLANELVTDEVARVLTFRLVDQARDEERGRALAEAFGRLNPEMADAVSRTLATTEDRIARRVLTEVLVRLAPEAQDIMAGFLQDARWHVVRDAVTVIGRTGIPNALQFLTTALMHDDVRVRAEAIRTLATVRGEDAALLARSYLDVSDASMREAAADAAGGLGDMGAVPVLLLRLDAEPERSVVLSVVRALGRIGDPAALPALEKRAGTSLLGRSDTEVRVAAIQALAALDTPAAWDLVTGLIDDRDEVVRGAAKYLLRSR